MEQVDIFLFDEAIFVTFSWFSFHGGMLATHFPTHSLWLVKIHMGSTKSCESHV